MLDDPSVGAIVSHCRDITARTRAKERVQQSMIELQDLHEVVTTLQSAADLPPMAQAILARAFSISGCDLGVIRLLERSSGKITLVAHCGYIDPHNVKRHEHVEEPLPLANGAGTRQRHRLRVFSRYRTHIEEDLNTTDGKLTFKNEGVRSMIGIPVASENDRFGIMQLGSRVARSFEPRLVKFLETLA